MFTKRKDKISITEGQEIIAQAYRQREASLLQYINWLPPGEHFSQRVQDFLLLTEQRFPIKLPPIQTGVYSPSPELTFINSYLDKIEGVETLLQETTVYKEDLQEILK